MVQGTWDHHEEDSVKEDKNMVGNTLVKAQPNTDIVTYMAGGQEVSLSPAFIKQYLVSGGGNITDQECMMFLKMCQYQGLNPFLREAYCIKYGSQPASMVVGKDTFIKRARHRREFDGFKAGVIIQKQSGEIQEREGSFCAPGEQLIGGWAKVFIKGISTPYYSAVAWSEYVGLKDGKPNRMWASKPTTMIRKVALSQALREAFPDDMGGLYEPEEINTIEDELDETPIEVPAQEPEQKPKRQKKQEPEIVIEPDDEDAVAASLFG